MFALHESVSDYCASVCCNNSCDVTSNKEYDIPAMKHHIGMYMLGDRRMIQLLCEYVLERIKKLLRGAGTAEFSNAIKCIDASECPANSKIHELVIDELLYHADQGLCHLDIALRMIDELPWILTPEKLTYIVSKFETEMKIGLQVGCLLKLEEQARGSKLFSKPSIRTAIRQGLKHRFLNPSDGPPGFMVDAKLIYSSKLWSEPGIRHNFVQGFVQNLSTVMASEMDWDTAEKETPWLLWEVFRALRRCNCRRSRAACPWRNERHDCWQLCQILLTTG